MTSSPPFTVSLHERHRTLTPHGELDYGTAPQVQHAATELIARNPGDTTLLLAELTFIDAAGIGAIITIRNTLAAQGSTLIVSGASTHTRRVFTVARAIELLSS